MVLVFASNWGIAGDGNPNRPVLRKSTGVANLTRVFNNMFAIA
jgi:hypothetical protein